jgi:hypothetical protein
MLKLRLNKCFSIITFNAKHSIHSRIKNKSFWTQYSKENRKLNIYRLIMSDKHKEKITIFKYNPNKSTISSFVCLIQFLMEKYISQNINS